MSDMLVRRCSEFGRDFAPSPHAVISVRGGVANRFDGIISRRSPATSERGAHPWCKRTTAPRYTAPDNEALTRIRAAAPTGPGVAPNGEIPRMITAEAPEASAEASPYRHTM